ncbi:MAG: hypothetical protein ACI9SX_001245 [Pseudoalteromonas tetraodonis]|jgi:hypothetical protein
MTNWYSIILAALTGIIVMAAVSPSTAEEVVSVSRSQFKYLENSRVWEAQVQCSSNQDVVLIHKALGTDIWCDAKELNNCEGDKNTIAHRLCEQNSNLGQSSSKSTLVKEKMRIEEEQLTIEQRKRVLRRKELILQKRALELNEAN